MAALWLTQIACGVSCARVGIVSIALSTSFGHYCRAIFFSFTGSLLRFFLVEFMIRIEYQNCQVLDLF